jgi:hypothetical protein
MMALDETTLALQDALLPGNNPALFQQALEQLVSQGERVVSSKTASPSRIIGDWQSTEILYAVVDKALFSAWRTDTLDTFEQFLYPESAVYWAFFDGCRFPQYMEAVEGLKLLKQVHFTVGRLINGSYTHLNP